MRLYKFLSADFALWDLTEKKIKISEFHDMNDPFELRGIRISNPVQQRPRVVKAFPARDLAPQTGATGEVLVLSRAWGLALHHHAENPVNARLIALAVSL